MRKFDRITVNPKVFQGQPCIRDMRIPVSLIVKLVSQGKTPVEIIKDYPELEKEDIKQALEFAGGSCKDKGFTYMINPAVYPLFLKIFPKVF